MSRATREAECAQALRRAVPAHPFAGANEAVPSVA